MLVLIDAGGLSPAAPTWVRSWWREVLPVVIRELDGGVVLLRRGGKGAGPGELEAPPYRHGDWALEDRRLAALVREIGADVFMSTCASSAGAAAATLAVMPPRPLIARRNLGDAALRLASGFLTFSNGDRKHLRALGIGDDDWVGSANATDSAGRASAIVGALRAVAHHHPGAPTDFRRSEAETQVVAAAETRRHRSLRRLERLAARAASGESPRTLRGLTRRAWRTAKRGVRALAFPASGQAASTSVNSRGSG